jgi:hypothetical protein
MNLTEKFVCETKFREEEEGTEHMKRAAVYFIHTANVHEQKHSADIMSSDTCSNYVYVSGHVTKFQHASLQSRA